MPTDGKAQNRKSLVNFSEEEKVHKYASVSRCYRSEMAHGRRERGIYRVHYFTKVEMFALTPANDTKTSDSIHKEMLSIQQHLFDQLKLAYRVLDMHPGDA